MMTSNLIVEVAAQEFTSLTVTRVEPQKSNVYAISYDFERLDKIREKNTVFAIHSNESGIDDSDADPNFTNRSGSANTSTFADSVVAHNLQAEDVIHEESWNLGHYKIQSIMKF